MSSQGFPLLAVEDRADNVEEVRGQCPLMPGVPREADPTVPQPRVGHMHRFGERTHQPEGWPFIYQISDRGTFTFRNIRFPDMIKEIPYLLAGRGVISLSIFLYFAVAVSGHRLDTGTARKNECELRGKKPCRHKQPSRVDSAQNEVSTTRPAERHRRAGR